MDDLDRSIARRTAKNPGYHEMLQAEVRRQRLIAALIAERKVNHLTQAQVAAEMNVSQSVVAEIESSKADVRYSTLDRYADAVIWGRQSGQATALPGPGPIATEDARPTNREGQGFLRTVRRTIGDGIRPRRRHEVGEPHSKRVGRNRGKRLSADLSTTGLR